MKDLLGYRAGGNKLQAKVTCPRLIFHAVPLQSTDPFESGNTPYHGFPEQSIDSNGTAGAVTE
jgi:hypothetical protein